MDVNCRHVAFLWETSYDVFSRFFGGLWETPPSLHWTHLSLADATSGLFASLGAGCCLLPPSRLPSTTTNRGLCRGRLTQNYLCVLCSTWDSRTSRHCRYSSPCPKSKGETSTDVLCPLLQFYSVWASILPVWWSCCRSALKFTLSKKRSFSNA